MKKSVMTIIETVVDRIKSDKRYDLMHPAYNHYQEAERDGADYLFDITNPQDINCCLDGGMTVDQLRNLLNDRWRSEETREEYQDLRYFFFGSNHPTPRLLSYKEWTRVLESSMMVVVPYVIAHPYECNEYKEIYIEYVTTYMFDNKII